MRLSGLSARLSGTFPTVSKGDCRDCPDRPIRDSLPSVSSPCNPERLSDRLTEQRDRLGAAFGCAAAPIANLTRKAAPWPVRRLESGLLVFFLRVSEGFWKP